MDLDGTEEEKLAFVDPLLAADANDVYSVISHQDNAVDNGDRVTFAKTYVRKKTLAAQKKEEAPYHFV